MAISKAKRPIKKNQLPLSSQHSAKLKIPNHKSKITNRKLTHFPQANGRVIKQVEFFVDSSDNILELTFEDDTTLSFEFQPRFAWEAYFARWKSGEQRILRRWPRRNAVLRY